MRIRKISTNTIILIVASIIFCVLLITIINIYDYDLIPVIIFAFLIGFAITFPLAWFLPYKILKYITYIVFSFLTILTILLILKNYYWIHGFYGYANFEKFLYEYPRTTHNLLIISIFRELNMFFLPGWDFISLAEGLILPLCLKIFSIEKRENNAP